MAERLKGKNIVITGASGGIGAEIARLCAERGANLALMARSLDKLQLLKKELEARHGIRVYVHQLDVAQTDMIENVFLAVKKEMDTIDILVNNAGELYWYTHNLFNKKILQIA
ncbi:SDR family NAD(P)-dependent oxidoreductase [Neobacillus terrae]|uniref:SDR family NAD(P)-dependent oxidoreductase n=1 Tax=Neobacillus terrae TaxID=3034837 RepID=UPI001409608A|nr:SDR family NAD(P)-dependent oxidoreductase [Neobacillus terrae]